MSNWHGDQKIKDGAHCGTIHCRAGAVVFLAGKDGRDLELQTSTLHAAKMIYKTSSPIHVNDPRFFDNNEQAMADIIRCAELEVQYNA